MSEPKTALDLAHALGREVIGVEHWNQSVALAGVLSYKTIDPLRDRLSAIPADAAAQIAMLRADVRELKNQAEYWASEAGQAP